MLISLTIASLSGVMDEVAILILQLNLLSPAGRRSSWLFVLNCRFQRGEACLPEDSILIEPYIDGLQRRGIEAVKPMSASAGFLDQARTPQEAEVF